MADRKALVLVSGRWSQVPDADVLQVGAGLDRATAGALTIGATTATSLTLSQDSSLAANKNLSMAAGTGAADLSGGSGIFKTTTGAVTVGPGAVTVSGAATFSAAGNALIVTNAAIFNGGIQRSTSGSAAIFDDANTTSISVGRTGQTVTINGNLSVSGTETIVGSTTFQGDFTFGDAATDLLTFTGRVNGDINFRKEVNASLLVDASTTTTQVGANLTVQAGAGAPAAGATAGANGGTLALAAGTGGAAAGGAGAAGAGVAASLTGGAGGAGTATGVAGAGANASLLGGAAGVNGGAGGASGGNAVVDGGAASGAGTAGLAQIGVTNSSAVSIGHSGITTTVTGGLSQLTGAVSLAANAASSFTTSAGALTITAAAASTWSTTAGALTLTSAAAATWSTTAGALTLTSAAAATWGTAAGALTLNGVGGINMQGNGTTAMIYNATGTLITVQAGATLETTGTGNINLPQNVNARFKIEGTATGATVTAANLGTLTDGSNADSLHVHSAFSTSYTAGAGGITANTLVYVSDNNTILHAKADAAGTVRPVIGVAPSAITAVASGNVTTEGLVSIKFVASLTLAAGDEVYVSAATAGRATNVAPSTGGQFIKFIGIVKDASTYAGVADDLASVQMQLGERAIAL